MLNEACYSEVLELEKQLLDVGKRMEERKAKIERNCLHAGDLRDRLQDVEYDPELQTLIGEHRSIMNRSSTMTVLASLFISV